MARRFSALFFVVLACAFQSGGCSTDGAPLTDAAANRLIQQLAGAWQGRATITPRGPLNYHIEYKAIPDGLSGTALPGDGNTRHVWTFRKTKDGRGISLEFLSTFGSNTETMTLPLVKIENQTYIFRHAWANFLEVRLRLQTNRIVKEIKLRNKAHVRIELKRQLQVKRQRQQST